MKKYPLHKLSMVILAACMVTCAQVRAADLAGASGAFAEIAALSGQAAVNLAMAALRGDVVLIAEAAKRADAVDAALVEAVDAYATLEGAAPNDDAGLPAEALVAAQQKAYDALYGTLPDKVAESFRARRGEGRGGARGGEGRGGRAGRGGGSREAYDPPNLEGVPWKSEGLRSFYQDLFGDFWNASAFGSGGGFGSGGLGDHDATPE